MDTPFPQDERHHVYDEPSAHLAVAAVRHAAEALRFPPPRAMSAAVCASELATNILKYARRGVISFSPEKISGDGPARNGLRITAEDHGPGIPDLDAALRDHFSTSGTLGLGLPGVRRMSDDFHIASVPGEGVRVSILLGAAPVPSAGQPSPAGAARPERFETGSARRPAPGEAVCGDTPAARSCENEIWLGLFDGTGHGRKAAEASSALAAGLVSEARPGRTVTEILEALHKLARDTVGAASGILYVDTIRGRAAFAGLGNIRMCLHGRDRTGGAPSADGVLGRTWRTPKESHFQLLPGDLLLLVSDGVSFRPQDSDLPVLRHSSPEGVARHVLRRFGNDHDDASCVAFRWTP